MNKWWKQTRHKRLEQTRRGQEDKRTDKEQNRTLRLNRWNKNEDKQKQSELNGTRQRVG
jgi:hypothetical protein